MAGILFTNCTLCCCGDEVLYARARALSLSTHTHHTHTHTHAHTYTHTHIHTYVYTYIRITDVSAFLNFFLKCLLHKSNCFLKDVTRPPPCVSSLVKEIFVRTKTTKSSIAWGDVTYGMGGANSDKTCMYVSMHTYVYMYIQIRSKHVCIRIRIYIHTYVRMYIYIRT